MVFIYLLWHFKVSQEHVALENSSYGMTKASDLQTVKPRRSRTDRAWGGSWLASVRYYIPTFWVSTTWFYRAIRLIGCFEGFKMTLDGLPR